MKMPRLNFNAGEISPELYWRSDLNKYASSMKRVENFIPTPQGGLKRRPGTELFARIGDVGTLDSARTLLWQVDRNDFFQLVISDKMDVFNEQGSLVFSLPSVPWALTDLTELYIKQVYDVMYVAHSSYPLQQIRRTSQFVWEIIDHNFNGGPFDTGNFDDTNVLTLTPSGANTVVTCPNPIFKTSDVGRQIRVLSENSGIAKGTFTSGQQGGSSASIPAIGNVSLRTEGGIWAGEIHLQQSLDVGATWETIGVVASENGKSNGEISRDVAEFGALVRAHMKVRTTATGDTGCIYVLEVAETQYNYLQIDTFTNASTVTCSIISGTNENTSTWRYAFSVFGEDEGYPTCVEIFEERLMLGGVPSKPATIFGSNINSWDTFIEGTLATSAIQFTLASDVRNRIRWFAPDQVLLVGSDNGEWTIGSREREAVLSGSNVSAKRHTQYGSDPVQPVASGDLTLFVEAGGRRLRGTQYSFEKDGYAVNDMSILALHLFKDSKIKRLTYSRSPDQIVWALREDGQLFAFTYNAEHQVSAWSRHPINGGKILDLNSVLTDEGDQISLLVERADGVYLEAIKQSELCIDWSTTYAGMSSMDFLSLEGEEDYTFYDKALSPNTDFVKGKGTFLRLINVPADLVIKYNTVQISNHIAGTNNLYWLPLSDLKGLVTVFDSTTQLTLNVDYELYQWDECRTVRLLDPSVDMSTVTFTYNSVSMNENVNFWRFDQARQFLLFGVADPALLTTSMTSADYSLDVPRVFINPLAHTDFTIGVKMISLAEPVDVFAHPEAGGPGTRNKIHEIDVFVVDSVGGEISVNEGKDYEDLAYIKANQIAGQKLEPFTGKIEVRLQMGHSDEQTVILRNDKPQQQTLAGLGIKGMRISE